MFDVVDVTKPVATAAGDVIAQPRADGLPLHDIHDVYVAATARAEQLAVLTANVERFERIDGVEVVDWVRY